nr:uncharacterized protein LOC100275694 [Ipomoea batatas]
MGTILTLNKLQRSITSLKTNGSSRDFKRIFKISFMDGLFKGELKVQARPNLKTVLAAFKCCGSLISSSRASTAEFPSLWWLCAHCARFMSSFAVTAPLPVVNSKSTTPKLMNVVENARIIGKIFSRICVEKIRMRYRSNKMGCLAEILSRRSSVIPPNSSKFPVVWHCSLVSFQMYRKCFTESNGNAILPDCLNRSGGIGPFKKLVFRSNHNKLLQFPNSAGISPEMELFPSFRMARLDKRPNEAGIAPLKKLFDSEIHFRLVQLLRVSGIEPDKSLKSRIRVSKSLHIPDGIKPEMLLELKSKVSKFTKLENDSDKPPTKLLNDKTSVFKVVIFSKVSTGNSPENLFLERSRKSRLEHEESEAPILPLNLLDDKSRCCKLEQSRNEGKFPEKLLAERSKYDKTLKLINSGILFPLRLVFFNTRLSKFSRPSNEATGAFGGYPVLKWFLVKNPIFEQ